ncbi:NADH-quinone oxidoreductase subunit A [Fundidesulfovibrio soli]|uniref:NADH-quinone oxidoreductase subunit A n=1 Tax=Fundidesulfovibrio soli TaxID=2922716 RepID=UPI001FAEEB72|nr:NADH-quinone oxidoreductase subunit A [Fundidesulfovibrio soli]
MSEFTPLIPAFSPWEPSGLSLSVFGALVLGLMGAMLFLAGWLGVKMPGGEKRRAYECGVIPTGTGSFRYPVPFFLTAVFFLIFDVETVYIVSWALAWDTAGLPGLIRMGGFILILGFGLAYAWRKGGLEPERGFGPDRSPTPGSGEDAR